MWRIELDCGFTLTALLTRQACEELALQENDRVLAMIKATNVHLIFAIYLRVHSLAWNNQALPPLSHGSIVQCLG
jgi:hypothetical protein